MRSDAVDPGQIQDVAELAAYIVRRQWCALAGTEQQCVGVDRVQLPQSPLYSCRGKPRKLNRASGARGLRVILPRRRFAFRAGDGSGDAHGRHAQVDVTAADREHFTDACGSAQHDLDDCAELPIGFRPRDLAPGLPIRDRGADPGDHLWRECVRHPHIAMQPCNMIDGISQEHLVSHGQCERESQHDTSTLRFRIRILREPLQKLVTSGNTDLAHRQIFERRQHERAHIAFIKLPCGGRQLVFQINVFEPVRHQIRERTVSRERACARRNQIAIDAFGFERVGCSGRAVAARLYEPGGPIPVAVAGACFDASARATSGGDLTVGSDRQTRAAHRVTPEDGESVQQAQGRAALRSTRSRR